MILVYRQQPSPLLYSIDIWPARNSRLTQLETNYYITRCASVLAWSYFAGRSPERLVIDRPFCTASAICCMLSMQWKTILFFSFALVFFYQWIETFNYLLWELQDWPILFDFFGDSQRTFYGTFITPRFTLASERFLFNSTKKASKKCIGRHISFH